MIYKQKMAAPESSNKPYIVILERQNLILFPKERWCATTKIDPSYVYDITDFSEGVVKLFLEDQIPAIRLLVIPRLVEYAKRNNMTMKEAIDIARGLYLGSETDIPELWNNAVQRTDKLEPTIAFVESLSTQMDYDQIYKNIQSAFSLRDYVLYGVRRTTYSIVDIYNRLVPSVSIPVLYYKDSHGNTVSKTNVRLQLRSDFNVETHLTNLSNDSIMGVLDISGRYVYFLVYQLDDNLTIETETLIGNEGYYCLSELQKFLQGFKWNIKDIRYKMSNFGSYKLPLGNPKEKKERDRLAKEREAVIRQTTSAIYSALLDICASEPLRYIFRPETTASTGQTISRRMKFRIVENDPSVWANYKGEAYIDIDDPENDLYEGGRMAFKLNKIGNVAISSVEAEKALGVDVRVDIETNLQDLINTLSVIWYAFLKSGSELISRPVQDVSTRKDVYILLKNTSTGIIRRAAPFISLWKNKICNQDIMPYFYNGILTTEDVKEIETLEQSSKYKGYKYDRNTVYKFPNESMLVRLKEKGYDLVGEPINIIIPKGKEGMFLKIRDAPRRLRDNFAGLTNNYAYLLDKTIGLTKREKDEDVASTTTGYILDSIKDEIPWEKNAEIDVSFLPSLGPIVRTGVPESGYSSFLAVALVVLTERLNRRPTLQELYKELKTFIQDVISSDRKKYFLTLWKFFPGGGFTEFGDMFRKFEQDVSLIDEATLVDKSTLFMDSKIYSRAYGIYFDRNVITMEYIEKNNDIFEPMDMDRLCFAYPEIPNHIAEDGLATEIFNNINVEKSSVLILRRRYVNINSQYDAVLGAEKKSFDTYSIVEELKKLLFEMNFATSIEKSSLNTDNVVNILVENNHLPLQIENMNVVGQFLDNTGRQTGIKVKFGKYELGMLFTRTRPIRNDISILPLTEANNPYNIKKIISFLQANLPEMKITHYSTVPIHISNDDYRGWMNLTCGFYFTIQTTEFFVPSALYEGVPTIFATIPSRPSVYPYHMFSVSPEGSTEMVSKLYNRQISDGLVSLILCAIRTTMIEKFLRGEWTKNTTYIDIARQLLDEENEPEVVPLKAGEQATRTGERYQEILNELRSEHRLPAKTNGLLATLRGNKRHYSLMFSKDNKILLKGISGATINNVKEISTRLKDQIRIMWKYIPELLEGVNKRRFLDAIDKYGSAHPIYRVHLLEDDSYYSYRYEGCLFLNGEEMIRNHYLISRKPHRTHHRLWTNLDTEHGPEFFLERGVGVHRITKTNVAGDKLIQLSENDYPSEVLDEATYQTREGTFFELSRI